MISILFFLPDLHGGGAQRTIINIVNHIDKDRFKPILVLGTSDGRYLGLINKNIEIIDLNKNRVRNAIFPLTKQIASRNPQILFSPYPDANVALFLARILSGFKGKLVLRESNNRTAEGIKWNFIMRNLVRYSYRRASRVVALSNGVRDDLINKYDLHKQKVITIYNPVDLDSIKKRSYQGFSDHIHADKNNKNIVNLLAAGRLVKQKGFDLLIKAVAKLKDKNIRLTILGEGNERENLLNLVDKLQVHKIVSMPGFEYNPYALMRRSDLFVLSSRWEGFGHVIAEAMACDLPVLAARCPSGPDEIITDNIDGMLCEPESIDDLADKIRFLVDHPDVRKCISKSAKKSVKHFDAKRIVIQYEKLFSALLC